MDNFEFKSNDLFYLWGRGFVVHGQVIFGQISNDDQVVIKTKKGNVYATVHVISKLSTKTLIKQSIQNEIIAIVLNEFSRNELNTIHERFDPETDKEPDWMEVLGVQYPILIYRNKKKKKRIKTRIQKWIGR